MSEVTYAYGVARDADGTLEEALAGVPGVAGAPVRLVRAERRGDVVVAAGSVPADDFDEAALRTHLEDLDWLEAVARAHHRVIERLAGRTTVLPLRLATVYLNDDRVRAMLGARLEAFARRLSELDGLLEWGVKIYVDAAEAEHDGGPAEPFAGSGRDYLRHRRAARNARDDAYRGAEEAAERVSAAARGYAVERARHRPQEGALAGGSGENVVNDAYLVPVRRAEQFRTEVERAAEGLPGIRVEVTGPWAPYSFTAAPETAARGSGP
ncbi:gas vesicle protein [Streptomyces sp. NRRL F-4489]|uniref:GvpL/GvpF family gas vesicle protein n=1 Tax=Streptomyces sp. NRRL F-4489 TaxID=1609095 RepID=UPI0007472BEC|nr:GvpL/GvpF family gas vesicle protein [Streptomyces sp. NRRL F-4489]KUL36863.1 gas vesicle protein [Streptomyces sp. NRRL F-4489]